MRQGRYTHVHTPKCSGMLIRLNGGGIAAEDLRKALG
jgi:hypothetical protein